MLSRPAHPALGAANSAERAGPTPKPKHKSAATSTGGKSGVHLSSLQHTQGKPLPRNQFRVSDRLAITSLSLLAAFAVALGVTNYAPAAVGDLELANAVAMVGVGLSLFMLALTRVSWITEERLVDLALVYEVLMGLGITLTETFATFDPSGAVSGISWVCLWIALFHVIVPSTPGKTLLAALATATMGPVAILIAVVAGMDAPSLQIGVLTALPNYIAAVLALILSRTLYRLRADAHRAEEMGSYQLIECIGEGGMGEVWRATHRTLARPVAIKFVHTSVVLHGSPTNVETIRKRFQREAQATARLSSRHTIQIFDFGITDDGSLYYAMELLDGIDLETLVRTHGPISPARAVHFLLQACDSLAEAHAAGLVHRDIKPANLHVCKLGTEHDCIKVLDFGLVTAPDGKTRLTADGTITGTPAYMAPEMIRGDAPVDARSDVYALGCVAYFLLTGRLVFEGKTPLEVVYGHTEKAPPSPSSYSPYSIPQGLEAAVLGCLEKDPSRRVASAEVLAQRLRHAEVPRWSPTDASGWWSDRNVKSPPARWQ